MDVAAIITAAGTGKRMGSETPKQFLDLGGRPILAHTLLKFENSRYVNYIIVTSPPSSVEKTRGLVKKIGLSKEWMVIEGGELRQDSVRNGLRSLPEKTEVVVIHDGVRPFIQRDLIDKSIEVAAEGGACIVAIPLKDTIKTSSPDEYIQSTLDRRGLWAAQTPQTFRHEILKEAFRRAYDAGFYGTDDASLVERLGRPVKLIMGSPTNIKITTPEDLRIAELFIKEGL